MIKFEMVTNKIQMTKPAIPRVISITIVVVVMALVFPAGVASAQTAPASPTPTTQSDAPNLASYLLGPEDVVTITVLRHLEYSGDYLIPPSGIIEVPVVGPVNASGLTCGQLSRKISDVLGKVRLRHPEVSATLKVARVQRIYVVGDIRDSGSYDLKPGWGVAQGLAAAGGLNSDVARSDVYVTLEHASGAPSTVASLNEVLNHPDDPNFKLGAGDTLRIEAKDLIPVYVSGRVKSPGLYTVRSDSADVLAAISQAGGLMDDASMQVRIVHKGGKEETADLSPALIQGNSVQPGMPPAPGGALQPQAKINLPAVGSGDMIVVEQSTRNFAVLGSVAKPGYYPLPDGRVYRLSDAVAIASGESVQQHGRLTKIGLVHYEDGKEVRSVYDLDKFLKVGDTTQNPVIHSGDLVYVPSSNRVDNTTVLGILSVGALLYSAFNR